MRKGVLTVFLSLTITIMLSLILALLQNARIGAVRMKAECAADIAMHSVLAEYNRALFEQYDLLMVDCSYQTASPSMAAVEEHLRYFLQGNFDRTTAGRLIGTRTMTAERCAAAVIPAYSFATDGGNAVLRRQILAYMEGEAVTKALLDASANLDVLSAHGYDTHDVEKEAEENRKRLEEIDIPEQEDADGEEREPIPDNPADAVESQKGIGVVSLAVPNPEDISARAFDPSVYTSHRAKNSGTGLKEEVQEGMTESFLIQQYMLEKTGCYTKPRDDSYLRYQQEYLIAGKNNDYDNLEHCARILLFWREAADLAYLRTDSAKVAEVEAVAAVISALLLCPELEVPLKWSMIFAWSFAEAINDMRILYKGGRVPLVKTADTWRISFANLAFFRDHLDGSSNARGLTYEDYLRMLLLLQKMEDKTDRMCDLIEMDVRQTPGNEHFRLDWCLDAFEADITVTGSPGCTVRMVRTCGYEE
ncbi:MAG: DUF5702 domain-containing protein [Lachnospiraceae bacterium]|nr:DUF5702 domain-containing protein [Lachnospiraceae bacterium]